MSKALKNSEIPIGTVFGMPDKVHVVTTSKPFKVKKYGPRDGHWYVKIKCSCGSPEKEAPVQDLRRFRVVSCGCVSRKIHSWVTGPAHGTNGGRR